MIDHALAAKMVEIDHNVSTYPLLKFETSGGQFCP